ncbi:MAG: hypothetical protein NTX40_05775 [Planctomycetota bacterium]|nr:hypothetical protein [Planctomycetota bacterium]
MKRPFVAPALLALALAFAAPGCGPSARISSAAGGKDQSVSYASATFQLARGHLVQIILFRRTPAPFGDADPDFEYVFFQVPERNRFGWVREDNLPVYRWVRENGKDQLWQGTAGEGHIRFGVLSDKGHIHFDFHVTMSPIHETPGSVYVFSGDVKCTEDLPRTQGLLNRYGEWLSRILATKPADEPPPLKPADESRRSRDESAGPQPPRNPMP